MSRVKMDILIKCLTAQLWNKKGLIQVKFAQRIAMYAYCYTYIKRLAGCGWCVAPNTIRMPNNKGLVFKVTWDKTLRMNMSSKQRHMDYHSKQDYCFQENTRMAQSK